MNARLLIGIVLLSLASSGIAVACAAPSLPEPGVLELLAISAVAGIAAAIRNRRK